MLDSGLAGLACRSREIFVGPTTFVTVVDHDCGVDEVLEVTESAESGWADGDWVVEHRFRAVMEVLDGAPVAEVARRYGTSRQSVHTWLRRFREGGRDGLKDRSRRPHNSPSRVPVEVELAICQLREAYPRWGARRIAHELQVRGVADAPGRSTVHRILVRMSTTGEFWIRHWFREGDPCQSASRTRLPVD